MKISKKLNYISFILVFFSSCVSMPTWQLVKEADLKFNNLNLNINNIPKDWLVFNTVGYNNHICALCFKNEITLLLTKDHPDLNYIIIGQFNIKNKLLPLNKNLDSSQSLLEIAMDLSNNFSKLYFCQKYKLIQVDFVKFVGKDGFRIMSSFKNPDGLSYRLLVYGTIIDNYLYTAKVMAPTYYYFNDILPDFEKLVSNITYKKNK